jgi:serine/threonine protein kinase
LRLVPPGSETHLPPGTEAPTLVDSIGVFVELPVPDLEARHAYQSVHERLFRESVESVPPVRIGRFRLLSKLGEGGMGEVYAAHDDDLDRRVAIKILKADAPRGSTLRMRREGQGMSYVCHPNVARVFEIGVHEGRTFLVMEYIKGHTLRQWCSVADRSWKDKLQVYLEAARGLAAAHSHGLVHRDFKPSNVLIDTCDHAHVLDFGLVHSGGDAQVDSLDNLRREELTRKVTRVGTVMGTPPYMAPEQNLGGPTDARTDQFSFCIALWEALAGEHPFLAPTESRSRLRPFINGLRKVPGGKRVPRRIWKVLQRGLSARPAERWRSMAELIEQLEEAVAPKPLLSGLGRVALFVGAMAASAWAGAVLFGG